MSNSNAIIHAERQMRRLAAPIVRNKIGERRAMELIGRLWVMTNSNYIEADAIMEEVTKSMQEIGLHFSEVHHG